jgi:hypothetical protein
MASGSRLRDIVQTTHAYPTWNGDITDASLQDLRVSLARLRPATGALLRLRRLLVR